MRVAPEKPADPLAADPLVLFHAESRLAAAAKELEDARSAERLALLRRIDDFEYRVDRRLCDLERRVEEMAKKMEEKPCPRPTK